MITIKIQALILDFFFFFVDITLVLANFSNVTLNKTPTSLKYKLSNIIESYKLQKKKNESFHLSCG